MELLPLLESKVSIRDFTDEQVSKQEIQLILEAGRLAPSAKNRQPWRFIAINKPETIQRLKDAAFGQEHVGAAPVIIAVCTTNIDYRMPNGQLAHPIDLTMATSYMMFQAEYMKLGSCLITTYDEAEVKSILTIPYSMQVPLLLLVGHVKEEKLKNTRKPLKSISSFNHW